jgi:hypothetical protein
MMIKLKIAIIISTIIIFFLYCSEDVPEFGEYYENTFTDSLITIMNNDTIKIIIEQFGVSSQVQEYIPYDTLNNNPLLDTLILVFDLKFGSYSSNPNPFKDIIISNDTLYIWYAAKQKPVSEKLIKKSNLTSITGGQTTPKLEYYNIEKVDIKKASNKKITFESKLYK